MMNGIQLLNSDCQAAYHGPVKVELPHPHAGGNIRIAVH